MALSPLGLSMGRAMPIPLLVILILAVVQGITEFLPISPDGHLVVVAALLAPISNTKELEVFDLTIALHAGTLLSILVFYFDRLWQLFHEDRRLIPLLIVATIPAVLIGLPLDIWGKDVLESPMWAGAGLIATGLVLLTVSWMQPGEADYREMTWYDALFIGLCQAPAVLPGLSRSGTTIAAGLGRGLSPQAAATFSFLLAVPAVGGAVALKLVKGLLGATELQTPVPYLALGILVAFIVGLAALWVLVRILETGRIQVFAWWCLPLGIAVISWQLWLQSSAG